MKSRTKNRNRVRKTKIRRRIQKGGKIPSFPDNDFFPYDDEDDYYEDEFQSIDEDQLISFLNEYYVVNPNKLPKSEIL